MKSIDVQITGISALLMHRFSEEDRAAIEARSSHSTARPSIQVAAERAAYRLPSNGGPGNLFIPAENLLASIRRAAGFRKIGRRSAVTAVCAGIFISPGRLDLGTAEYSIDSRPVVIAATKGRIMRHRPRMDNWKVRFTLEFDEQILPSVELVRGIVDDAGSKVGVGDFRPEKRGPFGRFFVTLWQT